MQFMLHPYHIVLAALSGGATLDNGNSFRKEVLSRGSSRGSHGVVHDLAGKETSNRLTADSALIEIRSGTRDKLRQA
jgi:hypothetical protein